MKRALATASVLLAIVGSAAADIQAPPASTYTSTRKLGRAIGNLLYAGMEIPEQMHRKNQEYGRKAAWSYGITDGCRRMFSRLGYGFYELFTFAAPTYRGTFRQPYQRCGEDNRIEMNPSDGLSEYPPELGFETYFDHSRTQTW